MNEDVVRYRLIAERGGLVDGQFMPTFPRDRKFIEWCVLESVILESKDPITILRRMSSRAANEINKDTVLRVFSEK